MNIFFTVTAVLVFISCLFYVLKVGGSTSKKVSLASYGIVGALYFYICNRVLNMLTGVYELEDNYTDIFMIALTVLPIIAALSLLVFSFYRNKRAENIFCNVYLLTSLGVAIAFGIICALSGDALKFSLIVFLPIHMLLPDAFIVSAYQSILNRSERAKLYIVNIVMFAAAVVYAITLIATNISFVDFSMIAIFIVVLYIGAIGLCSTVIEDKKRKKELQENVSGK